LLVKKDGSASASRDEGIEEKDVEQHPKGTKTKIWPCHEDDSWCPSSCSITNFSKGTIHSCSDKICRWNCLGLQGSLLMSLLESPIYLTTLTVGRKFSRTVCQRAVCCRAEGFRNSPCDKYQLNHPSLMETNVYMDESTHQMEGVKTIGEDASFDSTSCWVYWPGKGSDNADCIDGKTGLVISVNGEKVQNSSCSEVSTYSLLKINLDILRLSQAAVPAAASLTDEKISLSELRMLKRQLSAQYESAKDTLLLRHRVFRYWCRRESRLKMRP
jgi:hypothetical protein